MAVLPKDSVNAIIHLYRGEMGRMIAYRVRLDTTTRWAVATSAAILSLSLTNAAVPHLVFLLAVWLNLLFLGLEARRYGAYSLVRYRVRLLERGFYGEILGGPEPGQESGEECGQKAGPDAAAGGWQEALRRSIDTPTPRMGYLAACSVRLRRVYLWLMSAVYGAWLVKLYYHGGPDGMVHGARVGAVPGIAVLAIAFALLAALAMLAVVHRPPGDELAGDA